GGIALQARGRRERFLDAHSRARRRVGPSGFAVLRPARRGGVAPDPRPRMTVGVAILGSTGSIGCSALQVLARQRERFRVAALTAHSNADLLQRQAADWAPAYVGIVNGGMRDAGSGMRSGPECLVEAATRPDVQ